MLPIQLKSVVSPSIGRLARRCAFAAAIVFGMSSGAPLVAQQAPNQKPQVANEKRPPAVPPLAQVERGREMFAHELKPADPKTPGGDGLGPMFNGRSCVECHSQGGTGGGGNLEHNVDLLTINSLSPLPSAQDRLNRQKIAERITSFHPGFTADFGSVRPTITIHKFSTNSDYDQWRTSLLAFVRSQPVSEIPAGVDDATQVPDGLSPIPMPPLSKATAPPQRPQRNAAQRAAAQQPAPQQDAAPPDAGQLSAPKPAQIEFKLTQRSVPALFGAGLIDAIPDEVLKQVARDQAKRNNGVKGHVALASNGRAGKFGWRGQTATLKEFVMGACANELGLQVPGNNQGIDPLDPTHKPQQLDLNQEQCDDLTAYVASLPRPKQREPANAKEKKLWIEGAQLFSAAGCAQCHVEKLGAVSGLYSDLLLHDMGLKLSDPVGANPSQRDDGQPQPGRSPGQPSPRFGGYNGGAPDIFVFAEVPPETKRQWRTPPLWGLADSAPYLHDGRAPTVEDAIIEHDGEGSVARKNYLALPDTERSKLLAFLQSLAAPSQK